MAVKNDGAGSKRFHGESSSRSGNKEASVLTDGRIFQMRVNQLARPGIAIHVIMRVILH
jgi:hypothetical protein